MPLQNPRIALLVDQPQRDLAGLVLTSVELCRRGATCYLVPANERVPELWALAPDFVLMYCLRHGYEKLARDLDAAGIQFGLLDAEGGVWPDYETYSALLWDDEDLFTKVSCVCTWGPKLGKYLVQEEFFTDEQIAVTGCPRFDFYDPRWRHVLRNGQPYQSNRKRILINTNSTEANPRFASAETIRKHFCDIFGWTPERLHERIEIQKNTIEEMIALAQNLSRDYPENDIVLRPHPFEGTDLYKNRLGNLGNVVVNDSGPVQSQIFEAAAVIQRSCTTAIEASLASVPTFSPLWVPTPAVVQIAEDVSVACSSYEELRSHLKTVFSGEYQPPAHAQGAIDAVIRDWFHHIDGSSHSRVSDAIFSCIRNERTVDEDVCTKYLYGIDGLPRSAVARFMRRLRHILKLSPNFSFWKMRRATSGQLMESDQYFDLSDVNRLASRVSQQPAEQTDSYPVLKVDYAQKRGDYLRGYLGNSITVSRIQA